MKSLAILLENAADEPSPDLDGRTPLAVARCPNANRLAAEGQAGALPGGRSKKRVSPERLLGALAGLDEEAARLLSRGALEAWALDTDFSGYTHAFCANFVTLDSGELRDGLVSGITMQETERLAAAVQTRFDPARVRLLPRAPGRLVVLARMSGGDPDYGIPPWVPEASDSLAHGGRGSALFREVMERSAEQLVRHPVNEIRVDLGANPANAIWIWGGGPLARIAPSLLRVQFLTQSAMAAGFARAISAPAHALPEPWESAQPSPAVDTSEARAWLSACDRLIVYAEMPPEFHRAAAPEKVRLLERIDLLLIQPLLDALRRYKHRRCLLATVDPSAGATGAECAPQPFVLWGTHVEPDAATHWDEETCQAGKLVGLSLSEVMKLLSGE